MNASPARSLSWLNVARLSSIIALSIAAHGELSAETSSVAPNMFATLAGTAQMRGTQDGGAREATFAAPHSVAVDGARNVYVADTLNHTIRKIAPNGQVTTIAGQAGKAGAVDGPVAKATFNHPAGVAVDSAGNVYVADTKNHAVRKISAAGEVTTLSSAFNQPQGVAVDTAGNLYVADTLNNAACKISPDGHITTLTASFHQPEGIAVDAAGNVFVADTRNREISKIDANGEITVVARGLSRPTGVAVDSAGNLYVTEAGTHALLRITADGRISTLGGTVAQPGAADGATATAQFNQPAGVAVSAWGDLYVADAGNHAIREGYVFFATPEITGPLAPTLAATTDQVFEIRIAAAGIGPLSYQWFHEGQAIVGANQPSLSTKETATVRTGAFSVAVTDDLGRNEKTFLVGTPGEAVAQAVTGKKTGL